MPPLAWRDALIAEQRQSLSTVNRELRELRAQARAAARKNERVRRPSFYYKHHELRRTMSLMRRHGRPDPIWQLNPKPVAYRFAQEHGIRVPKTFAEFPHAASIDWDMLPDEFVLKTLHGAGGAGVIALERAGDGYRNLFDGELTTAGEVVAVLDQRSSEGRISRRLMAEELLSSPYPGHPGPAPDVKIYCFYGHVGLLMVRQPRGGRIRVRYFDPDGTDLGDAMQHLDVDPSLPEPLHRKELLSAAQRLSAAMPRPFVRLDFFEQPEGIVFGEITPSPGGHQHARRDIDERLGALWEDAEARLRVCGGEPESHQRFATRW